MLLKEINLLTALWIFLSLTAGSAYAEPPSNDLIAIKSGNLEITEEKILLDANVEFNLPLQLTTALHKGVELVFMADIQILRERGIWFDEKIINIKIPRRLQFHALSRKYIVNDMGLTKRASFNSLDSAMDYLGKYSDIEIIQTSFAQSSVATYARMRIRLQRSRLPLPLRLKSYFSLFWSIESDWKVWTL